MKKRKSALNVDAKMVKLKSQNKSMKKKLVFVLNEN